MKKTFIYMVGAYEFRDTVAFGDAWKEAIAKASELHSNIKRIVESDKEMRFEFLTTACVFLNMKFYKEEDAMVF